MDEQTKIQKKAESFSASIEWLLRSLKEKRWIPLLSLLTLCLFAESLLGNFKPVIKKIADVKGRPDWLNGLYNNYSAVLITLAAALVVIIIISLLKKCGPRIP
jgi:hypothetical protein